MEAFVDWQAFQRLDNASVVDFLTSTAGALCEQGVLGPKDADNLRLVLSSVLPEAREKPILLALSGQGAEFLTVLEARYGTTGFCLNLLRHSLKGPVSETQTLLAEWGQALIKRAELLFNRPVVVVSGGREQGHVLASTLLIDFAETLADACQQLASVQEELGRMNPHAMGGYAADDVTIDMAVATALGFSGLVDHTLPAQVEHGIKRKIGAVAEVVAAAAQELTEQVAANGAGVSARDGAGHCDTRCQSHAAAMAVACEWLSAEAQRVHSVELPKTASLHSWEVRRRNLASALAGLNEAMRLLVKASLEAITPEAFQPSARAAMTDAAHRRVAFDLIRRGTSPGKAWTAASDLLSYLAAQRLTPKEVLPGEVTKLNPLLTPDTLKTLVDLADGNALMSSSSARKASTQSRAQRLAKAFTTLAPLILVACAFVPISCGLKTRPESDVNDFRPDVPFRSESLRPSQPDSQQRGPAQATPTAGDTRKLIDAAPNVLETVPSSPR